MFLHDEILLTAIMAESTNHDGDPRRYKMLADMEHDDPDDAPTHMGERMVRIADVWVTQEKAKELETDE